MCLSRCLRHVAESTREAVASVRQVHLLAAAGDRLVVCLCTPPLGYVTGRMFHMLIR
jgi:hypothetical protein